MISLNKNLKGIHGFGADGEAPLANINLRRQLD